MSTKVVSAAEVAQTIAPLFAAEVITDGDNGGASVEDLAIGDVLLVRVLSGAVVERRVVGESDMGPLVAPEEEYQAALREGREPESIGWPADHIIGKKEVA